jgi:hypothetical protein
MPPRAATTILLITQHSLIRADLSAAPKTALIGMWDQPRPDLHDLTSLTEAAIFMGPKIGKRVWVLATDLWTQTLELPVAKAAGLAGPQLASALNFEAESLSGHNAFDSVVAHVALAPREGQQPFWIVQGNAVDIAQIDQVVRKEGGRLAGVTHPGGLARALTADSGPQAGWQRVELWPDAVVMLHGAPGQITGVQVINSDPQMGRWRASLHDSVPASGRELLTAPGMAASAGAGVGTPFFLDDQAQLTSWLIAQAEHLSTKDPRAPILRPQPVPLTPAQRRRLAFVIAVAVGLLCYGHYSWMDANVKALNAERDRVLAPGKVLPDLQKQTKDLETKRDELKHEVNILVQATERVAHQRERVGRLLQFLAEHKAEDLLVQRIDGDAGDPRVVGACLKPELADEFARTLAEKLRPFGFEVQSPHKQAADLANAGAPWEFQITLRSPADAFLKPTPVNKRR